MDREKIFNPQNTKEFIVGLDDLVNTMKTINSKEFVFCGRKKLYLLCDVETIGVESKLTYDISYLICDKEGNIYRMRNFLVREVFNDMETMQNAYYFKKYHLYIEMLNKHFYEMYDLKTIINKINEDLKEFNIDVFTAYNCQFDVSALNYTIDELKCPVKINYPSVECVWAFASNTIMNTKRYRKWALQNQMLTASGKYFSSTAETCFRYLSEIKDISEYHLGALDIFREELTILNTCNQYKIKADKTPNSQIWRKHKLTEEELQALAEIKAQIEKAQQVNEILENTDKQINEILK